MDKETIIAHVKKERPGLQYVRVLTNEEVLEGMKKYYLFKKYGSPNIPVENRRGILRFKNGRKLNQLQTKNYDEKLNKNKKNLGAVKSPMLLFQGTEGFLKKKPFYSAVFENGRTGTLMFEMVIPANAPANAPGNKRGKALLNMAGKTAENTQNNAYLNTIQLKGKQVLSKPNLTGFRAKGPAQREPPPGNFRKVPPPSISSANALLARASMTNEQRKANQSTKRRAPAGTRFSLPNLRGFGPMKRAGPGPGSFLKYKSPKINTRLANSVIMAVSQALRTAKTPATAKSALNKKPSVVQRQAVMAAKANVTPAVAKAMSPSILAKAIIDLISAGIKKIPAPAAAAALTAPAPVAKKVAQGMDSASLSAAIVELVRQGIKPRPEVVAEHPEPAKIITNAGNLSKRVAKLVMNSLPKSKVSAPKQAEAISAAVQTGVVPPPSVIAPVLGNRAAAAKVAEVTPPNVLAASILNAVSRGLPVHPAGFGQNPAQVAAELPSRAGGRAGRVSDAVNEAAYEYTNVKLGNRLVKRARYSSRWNRLTKPPRPPQNNGSWRRNGNYWIKNIGPYQGAGILGGSNAVVGPPRGANQTPSAPILVQQPNGNIGIAVPRRQANTAAQRANAAAQRAQQAVQTAPTPQVRNAATQAVNEAEKASAAAQKANAAVGTNAATNAAKNARKAAANANAAAAKAEAKAKPNNKNLAKNAAAKAAIAKVAGGAGGSTTITFAPNIKIQLGNLAKAAEAAKNNPNKQANLENLLANLKSKLPANSQTLKTVNNLFKAPNKIPSANQVRNALAKSYSNMNINELVALRKTGKNKDKVEAALREQVQTQLRRIGRLGSSERGPMLASLYKALPQNFKGGRAMIERNLRTEMREASRRSNGRYRLDNLRRNFGSVLPSSLKNEYKIAAARALRENRAAPWRAPTRQAPLRQNYLRQAPRQVGGSSRLRAEAPLRERIPENKYRAMRQEGPLPLNISAPLPPNQAAAIHRAGGHNVAVNTIAAVPGGAPKVALAAQALNEANGNRAVAIERGADPVALNAVAKLAGKPANSTNAKTLKAAAKNASYVIEGLHHRARAHKSRKSPKPGVNLNALNNVINAVRKKKLVSIVAHKVTKTNNIHENENRKKKAYKSLVKAQILKRPLAAIARRAAKKRTAKK
jgi:hypothetical protein